MTREEKAPKNPAKRNVKAAGNVSLPAVAAKGKGKRKEPFPAYYLSLTVENVRCFGPKQTLDLSRGGGRPAQWTIILGDNGVGKTTLLECLAGLQAEPVRGIGSEGTGNPFVVAKILQSANGDPAKYVHFGGTSGEMTCEMESGTRLSETANPTRKIRSLSVGFIVQPGQRTVRCNTKGISGPLICYGYGASRRMSPTSLSSLDEDQRRFHLFDESADLRNPEEWLLQADYSASKRSPVAKDAACWRDQVREVLIGILPDVEHIEITQPSKKRMVPTVLFKTPYGDVPFHSLSLGYRTLIAWMVDFASRLFERYPDSPNPLAEPAVVLVDEIDLHLHPTWQRRLLRYLSERFPNTQFIATAHSPLVVQAAEDANIVLLRREGGHVVIENKAEEIRGWRVDQILTSDLFGLESARPPQYEELLSQRERLLSKKRLAKKDREALAAIEAKLEPWPLGESKEDMDAIAIVRREAARLREKQRT